MEQWRTELYFQCGRSERRHGSNSSNANSDSYSYPYPYPYADTYSYSYADTYPNSNPIMQSDSSSRR